MRRFLFLVLFLFSLGIGVALNVVGQYRDVFYSICDLTSEHFYKEGPRLRQWVQTCQSRAAHLPLRTTSEKLLTTIQDQMDELNVSHFSIFSPSEDRKLWKGESVDTGIRARYIEDHLVIYRVLEKSSGWRSGVRIGDEILALPGADQVTPYGAEHRAGLFKLRRAGRDLALEVAPSALNIDSSPSVMSLGGGAALLTISSFRAEFFAADDWRAIADQLLAYRHVIIDVRENAGGNFVAMLRALSTFDCGGRLIGHLIQPRKDGPSKASFDDDTQDAYQLDELEKYRSLGLLTYADYGCYRGRVTVLISSETASTAEIFADSFKSRPQSRVWGQPSAGDVVLAVWYDLPALGEGYSVSIPEAVYLNAGRKELEGHGVFPQRELHYDLQTALRGQDSWVLEASTY